jgi:hypothetical protein
MKEKQPKDKVLLSVNMLINPKTRAMLAVLATVRGVSITGAAGDLLDEVIATPEFKKKIEDYF